MLNNKEIRQKVKTILDGGQSTFNREDFLNILKMTTLVDEVERLKARLDDERRSEDDGK